MDTPSLDPPSTTDNGKFAPKGTLRERLGKTFLARLQARRRLGAPLERIPDNLHRTARQLALGLEMIEDFRQGRYRAIPWGSLAVLTGALLYTVSPADVLPDTILGLGALDDAIVLSLATRVVRRQLEAYCEFKGYRWEEYFAPIDKRVEPRRTTPIQVEPADFPLN
jgi:uncharacterized membrane protein YkvA (DUF1232 family)